LVVVGAKTSQGDKNMELWIRSQDMTNLVKVDDLCIENNEYNKKLCDIVQGCILLGTYNLERAKEVLDEIEKYIEKQGTMEIDLQNGGKYYGKVYEMPKE
jgi:hypothetical protein